MADQQMWLMYDSATLSQSHTPGYASINTDGITKNDRKKQQKSKKTETLLLFLFYF